MFSIVHFVILANAFLIGFGENVTEEGSVVIQAPIITAEIRADLIAQAHSVQNCYRQKHQALPLELDDSISTISQNWANHLATLGQLQHSGSRNYGENLFAAAPSIPHGALPIYYWYKEWKDCGYNFGQQSLQEKQGCATGHFTQMVWKGSLKVGFGLTVGLRMTFFVANYAPPGNYIGQNAQNVGRPSDSNVNSCVPQDIQLESINNTDIQIL